MTDQMVARQSNIPHTEAKLITFAALMTYICTTAWLIAMCTASKNFPNSSIKLLGKEDIK